MWTKKKEKLLIKWSIIIISIFAVVMWGGTIIVNLLEPKIDYDAMHSEMMDYVNQLENIKEVKYMKDGRYYITLEDSSWYSGSERDKLQFCLNVNKNITYVCRKYKTVEEDFPAYIYYYDESGLRIAEPSDRLGSLESKILY